MTNYMQNLKLRMTAAIQQSRGCFNLSDQLGVNKTIISRNIFVCLQSRGEVCLARLGTWHRPGGREGTHRGLQSEQEI